MKSILLSYLSILTILSSCSIQTSNPKANETTHKGLPVKGDTVKELGNNIMHVYQDKKNVYWFGSWETGVYTYDGKTIINYTTEHGLLSNRIDEIKEDQAGNIYFTSCSPNSSITKFDGKTFMPLSAVASNDWKLNSTDLWFRHSYENEKVYRYDGTTLHELQLPKPAKLSNRFEIYSIYKDRNGNIWFGTNPSGVCRYNGKSFDWITEEDVTEFRDEAANGVRSIIEDGNGDFWFNTEQLYSVYDIDMSNRTLFYKRQKSIGSLDGKNTSGLKEYLSIAKDNDNNLWFATYLHGAWKYDGKIVTRFPVQYRGKDITVFSVYKDNSGQLWVGTHENGVYKFNGATFEKFIPF
jgi:ligand-binding sensor domain-containing protein